MPGGRISQPMLTLTLRRLERDGHVDRTVSRPAPLRSGTH
ncbi:winged helix-turn-helix transcriptional regulator [Nocardia sp. NPDC057440]